MKNEGVREKWKRGKVKGGNGIKKRSKTPLFGIICLLFFIAASIFAGENLISKVWGAGK